MEIKSGKIHKLIGDEPELLRTDDSQKTIERRTPREQLPLSGVIIYFLSQQTLRFSELKRKLPHVTEANLTKELRVLEQWAIEYNAQ